MPAMRLEGLTKHYGGATQVVKALDGVSLQIEQGEFVAVVGRSGSGKTTMLDCAGLLMRRIHRERRVTFLIVTHDLDLAAKAGRIIHLRDGHLAGDERVESVRSPVAAA
jgi:ABC-type lipoprotein export system ATPase subunit